MQEHTERRISVDIDTLLAIIGLIAGFIVAIWLKFQTTNQLYPIMGIFLSLACLTYLITKRRLSHHDESNVKEQQGKPRTYLLLSIAFFIVICYSLVSIITRSELYSRPLGYFLGVAVGSAVVAIQVLILPSSKGYVYFTLLEIIVLATVLVWTTEIIFPGIYGFDPVYHSSFTNRLLSSGHIPPNEGYTPFPVMHLNTAITMLLANLNYKLTVMLFTSFSYIVISLSFVFLLGDFVHSPRVGLMASLLLGFISYFVQTGWWMSPNGYAMIFLLSSLWLLFNAKSIHSIRLMVLAMLLSLVLIFTHTIAALTMALVLFLSWLSFLIYAKVYLTKSFQLVTLTFYVLFTVVMFTWWTYQSPLTIDTLQSLIKYGFSADVFSQPTTQSLQYMSTIPFMEHLLRILGQILFWAISFVGCLTFFSKRRGNALSFVLCITGLALFAIGFFSGPLGLGTIPERWQFMSMFLLAIPSGMGLILVCSAIKRDSLKIFSVFVLITVISLISVLSPDAQFDNSLIARNSTVRYAFKISEQQAATTISSNWGLLIATDPYYYLAYTQEEIPSGQSLTDNFISEDFNNLKELVVIREEIAEKPFYLPGIFKLDYDPRLVIANQGFSQVYDCGTVSAFFQNLGQ